MWSKIMLNPKKDNIENGFLKPEYPLKAASYLADVQCAFRIAVIGAVKKLLKCHLLKSETQITIIIDFLKN